MAGLLDQLLQTQLTARDEREQHDQRVLHQGQAGGGLPVILRFLGCRMGRVVGRNDVDAAILERLKQGQAVGLVLDRWVAFDGSSTVGVVAVIEEEVMHANLRRDALIGHRPGREEGHLTRGGQVQHMQPRIVLACEADSELRRGIAGLVAADAPVLGERHVVAVFGAGSSLVGLDDGGVLTVGKDGRLGIGKNAF